tara:strand:- start:3332 stop:4246 length:915 start_codon:yes stop_codon:yes gene_type:complete
MADNKWTRPTNPPPPLFLGQKERNLVKQVNDELLERVVGQPVLYLPVSMEYTNFHPLYGEAIEKCFLPPIRVYVLVDFEAIETTTENFGLDKMHTINVKFHERRLHEDQNTYIREGDYIQYGHTFYEIVTLTEDRPLFGQVDHLFQIMAKCVRTRKGLLDFEVLDTRIQDAAIANAQITGTAASPSGDEGSPASGSESASPYTSAAKIVHGAEDSASPTSGLLASTISSGTSVNDFFSIPEGQVLEADTIMVFLNGMLQLLTTVEGAGDFYINETNQIITNYELHPGDSLVVVFLSAITSHFGV